MRLIPHDTTFFDLFDEQADNVVRAAEEMAALFADFDNLAKHAATLDDIEHHGDDLTHQLHNRIDETFITPLDKEDMRALSSALDDVVDLIEAAASRMVIYKVDQPQPDIARLGDFLVQITRTTREAVRALRVLKDRDTLKKLFVEIHRIENASDETYRQALGRLFEQTDPICILKWKEIYDRVEVAVDKCEDVANIVEHIAVKYA